MSAYQLHRDGDCWPDTCPLCPSECEVCGDPWRDCTCPTNPEDDE